jgi:tetratricopeptide (TPR) repeat protein
MTLLKLFVTEMPTVFFLSQSQPSQSQPSQLHRATGLRRFKRTIVGQAAAAIAGAMAIATLWATPTLAGDPFRESNPRAIDDQTEAAFNALFEQGNYRSAEQLLQSVETDEPLAYAMKASLAYMNEDLDAMAENATLTREAAERLIASDPLRGNIYVAAGHFLEGAHTLTVQGVVRGTPTALSKLQLVFDSLKEAEEIDPLDPELNLVKGYMDLMLAVNLPFSDPAQAIERLESYAAPEYLVQRGIAIAYRDLNRQEEAMAAVDQALQATPDNPDLLYLKAQILVQQERDQESLVFFQQALARQTQLLPNLAGQIAWEACRADSRATGRNQDCSAARDSAEEASQG